MSLTSQLQQAQPRHSALISELASLDHSPSAVSTCDHSISSLTKELGQVQQRLDELERATNETSKEMQELKDSTGRRLLYKLGGKGKTEKFEGRKEEKEKEYFAALEEEHVALGQKEMLEREIAEAQGNRADFLSASERHTALRQQLDSMYSKLFSGKTTSFPDEDRLEEQRNIAEASHKKVQTTYHRELLAEKSLSAAKRAMEAAIFQMQESLSYGDVFGGRRMIGSAGMAVTRSQQSIVAASRLMGEVSMHVSQANQAQPLVGPLQRSTPPGGSILSDVFYDNITTNDVFQQRMNQSDMQMRDGMAGLDRLISESEARKSSYQQELSYANKILDQARRGLEDKRKEIFESIGGGAADGGGVYPAHAPPEYQQRG